MKFQNLDTFGLKGTQKFTKSKDTIQSKIGAFLSIISYFLVICYVYMLLKKMLQRDEKERAKGMK